MSTAIETPVYGKDKILKFRLLENATKEKASKLALQTEHTITFDPGTDSTTTKDGVINYNNVLTTTIDITAVMSRDEVNEMLYQSVVKGKTLEVWEIDLQAPIAAAEGVTTKKFKARYGQGLLSTWEDPSNVEDLSELSTTMNVNGTMQDGEVVLTDDEIEQIQYAFRDTDVYTPPQA